MSNEATKDQEKYCMNCLRDFLDVAQPTRRKNFL
jgi:hypothetical protein